MIFSDVERTQRLKWAFSSCKNGTWGTDPDGINDVVCIRAADFDGQLGRLNDGERTLRAVEAGELKKFSLRKGDLILEKSGGGEKQLVGRSVLFHDDTCTSVCSNFLARCRPSADMDSDYLNYLLLAIYSVRGTFPHIKQSTGLQNLDIDSFLSTRVKVPTLDVQRRIVQLLNEKTTCIDALIEKKQALLKRLAERRQAVITRTVTKGLNPDAPMKPSGIDWLGRIPRDWKVRRLRFVAKLISGSTPTTSVQEYWNGQMPWISPKDVKSDDIRDSEDKVTDFAIQDFGLRVHCQDNALIVIRGMILARKVPVAVARGCYTINQDMKVIQSKGDLLPEYIQLYLASIESWLFTLVAEAGHGTKALRTDVLLDTPMLIPPIEEQDQIVKELTIYRAQTDNLIQKVSSSIDSLSEYRAAIVTACVTGQMNTSGG